jgi:hypothetical protein
MAAILEQIGYSYLPSYRRSSQADYAWSRLHGFLIQKIRDTGHNEASVEEALHFYLCQETRDVTPTSHDLKANYLHEYAYRVAILLAVIVVLWTVA